MIKLYERFEHSIRWNALEAGVYQGLLFAHHIALFFFLTPEFYGIIGTIFSTIYLCVTLCNGGLDYTLPVFFPAKITSRHHFRHTFGKQVLPELSLLAIVIGYALWYGLSRTTIPLYTLLALALLLVTESLKKTAKTACQLLFLSREVATIELCSLFVYILCVWSSIAAGIPLTLTHVFVPMSLLSLGSLIALTLCIYRWYMRLEERTDVLPMSTYFIAQQRFFNYITQISHSFFSSNFIVPFFAIQFGAPSAAGFKLLSTLVQACTFAFKKIFYSSATALFAHMHHESLADKQSAFAVISQKIHYGMLWLIVIFFITGYGMLYHSPTIFSLHAYPTVFTYIVLIFSEYFFVAYEILFVTQAKPAQLSFISLASLALTGAALYLTQGTSPCIILIVLCLARSASFVATQTISYQLWRSAA